MERWTNKVTVVTGASAGIGAAICKDLVQAGMIVVGLARRRERVESLRVQIPKNAPGKLYAVSCDVEQDDDIVRVFDWIAGELGAIHVLVNNAGILHLGSVIGTNSNESHLRSTVQTNLWGPIACTRKAVEIMRSSNVRDAHVIMINSISGHKVLNAPPGEWPMFNVYPVTKFGITALVDVLRQEFNADGLGYKITSISPGLVKTEIFDDDVYEAMKVHLRAEDVSNAVLYALGTPANVQITELTLKAVGEQF